jgi:hypothetical protein
MAENTDIDTEDDTPLGNLVILTPDEMLFKGLTLLLGWDTSRVEKWNSVTALEQYCGMYDVNTVVATQL